MDYDELTEANRQAIYARVLPSALAFVLGFSVVFISLGAGAAAINPFILGHKDILGKIAGVFIILLGLHMSGILRLNFAKRTTRAKTRRKNKSWQWLSAFGLGLAFAFGWTPVLYLILATIFNIAASSESLTDGIILLSFYALGLGVPFILTALGVSYFMQSSSRLKKHMQN